MKRKINNKKNGFIVTENELLNWHKIKEYIALTILLGMILHAIDTIIWPDISLFE